MNDDQASKDELRWEIRRSLIERLRIPWEVMGEMANQQRGEAAVQISTMMDEIEAWRQAMQKAERDMAELRDQLEVEESAVNHLHTDRNNLRLELDRLRQNGGVAERKPRAGFLQVNSADFACSDTHEITRLLRQMHGHTTFRSGPLTADTEWWISERCEAQVGLSVSDNRVLHRYRLPVIAADMIERLRAERDEARRELCAARRELCRNEAIIRLQRHRVHRDSEDVVGLAKEIAVERGWDCFKENTNV